MSGDNQGEMSRGDELEFQGWLRHLAKEEVVAKLPAILNRAEDLATAAEDADLVFEIMALKESLGITTHRPSTPPN